MNPSILEIRDLAIGYGSGAKSISVAAGINLRFDAGKLVALVGANGIGKSTLLRTISGVQKPVAGEVWLGGYNIASLKLRDIARQISLVLTEKLPPGNGSALEIVASGRQPYTNWIGKLTHEDRKEVTEAMALTGTTQLANRRHFELSDGQLQRVMIARALAQDTPVIILDEPTTHLDLAHKASLFDLLEKLAHETDKCILFSTHDIELAIERSDAMILMAPGKLTTGTPKQLIEDGAFDALFKESGIGFDPEKVKFVFTRRKI
jgi:iron complex transport system ATP-binding protein